MLEPNRQINQRRPKKTQEEEGWHSRGTRLLVSSWLQLSGPRRRTRWQVAVLGGAGGGDGGGAGRYPGAWRLTLAVDT